MKHWFNGLVAVVLSLAVGGEMAWGVGKAPTLGVNVHSGGNAPAKLAEKLAQRGLRRVRMDYWGNDPRNLEKVRNAANLFKAKSISVEAVVYSKFSAGQSRHQEYEADLAEVENACYESTKPQIEKIQDLITDFELQNEISLYKGIKVPGSSGETAEDFDTPTGRLQAAVLRGMSRAIGDVRKASGRPLRVFLGTTDRSWGMLRYFEAQGVTFDVVGYHIYPWEQHKALDVDPWFGEGGPLGQLAKFGKPISINEFNSGEIYSGCGGYTSKANYENRADDPVTEAGFRSLNNHLKEILNQKVARVESVLFYEAWDEPRKAPPENRFGLYADETLEEAKISLLIASSYAGGSLSKAEKEELAKRKVGQGFDE